LQSEITEYFDPERCLPDPGQGIIVVESRVDDWAAEVAGTIDDRSSRVMAVAERAVAHALEADCHSPVGALAEVGPAGELRLRGFAMGTTRNSRVKGEELGHVDDAEEIGTRLGRRLRAQIAEV
jgi:hydroxymethylbilane synthase